MLLYGRDRRGRYGIYHINLETGKTACVHRRGEAENISLVGWRDDQNFLYGRLDQKNNRGEIWVRNLDNGSERVLFSTSAVRASLAVSPDRRWVSATESYQSGDKALRIISTDSGEVSRLIKFSQEQQFSWIRHAWSADSKYVFYTRYVDSAGLSFKFEMWRVPIDGGQPQKTGLEMPGAIDHISAHPDGEHIAFENMAPMSASPAEVWVMENFLPLLRSSPK
jgi:Tol biopolymer transport system component